MSFNYEIKLTAPQINVLMYFIRKSSGKKAKTLPKGTSIASVRALVSDGLLLVKKGYPNGTRPSIWEVTRKGYLIGELIREETRTLNLPKMDTNFINWYHMPHKSLESVSDCQEGNVVKELQQKGGE